MHRAAKQVVGMEIIRATTSSFVFLGWLCYAVLSVPCRVVITC